MLLKQTKIVASISDRRCDVDFIKRLFEAGMNVCAMSPLLYAVEHFYTADGKLPENDSQLSKDSWFESAGYAGREDIIKLNTKREPRFYAWLSFDGDEFGQKICDGSPLIVQVRNSLKQGYNPSKFNRDNCTTGYFLKKWAAPDLTFRKDGGYNYRSVPTPFIRDRKSVV